MSRPAFESPPLGAAQDAAAQLGAAVRFILDRQGSESLSLIAHSWGSMPAGLFAGLQPASVDRLVLFAPISRRDPGVAETAPDLPAWRIVTCEDQWTRFVEDVPAHEAPLLSRADFAEWSKLYLDSDPDSRSREPAGVRIPMGPFSDIVKAWRGQLAYDPARIRCPVAIIRDEWDSLLPDGDAQWLLRSLEGSADKRDIKLSRGTHLMHLEVTRPALWRESVTFLLGDEVTSTPV
jgi:pimeloyl-ACP methyl ester carboxylesterase